MNFRRLLVLELEKLSNNAYEQVDVKIVHIIKNHTHVQAHLRIFFSHLLMNLKNKYLLKKLLKWVNKKQNNFNIYNV